jgi:RNA polymerase sigma-54 factor
MALGPRLDLRPTQSLVMTPQLQQAIKLLALSNLEIEAFIGEALESNPLLDAGETRIDDAPAPPADNAEPATADELMLAGAGEADAPLDLDPDALDRDRDTGDWSAAGGAMMGEDGPDIDEHGAPEVDLATHLEAQVGPQVGLGAHDPRTAFIARHIIGLLDEAGYLPVPLREVVSDLGISMAEAEAALDLVQSLDPTGVGARSLGECLALQAKEADRYDPCMQVLIANLDLLAKGSVAQLKRICDVDDEDFAEMMAELRGYDPKPGLRFGGGDRAPVVPDVLITATAKGGWDLQINQATLPRLVVNRQYYVELRGGCADKASKAWLSEKLADANWLIKALDQRQKTILKVTAEIVKQQEGFFRKGVSELRPMTLNKVAEAIEMHESTISRVTSNKYLHCDRGTFELKYFFTSGVGSADGEGASAEAVKARIKALIDAETADAVLSDDTLVDMLKTEGFELARRTVAKYREAIGLGSSVQRRRQKKLAGV